jgi:16S rRNA (cytidine1402-2'-O)-methyltransferase
MDENSGKLYIVTTPIGNLEDITLRALRVLKEVDFIAAEDTRRTAKLLNHFEIKTHLVSYHIHNEHRKTSEILEKVAGGMKVALVSDAGTPCIADPGFLMVREALKLGIEPEIIPGVSSLTFAVAAAGIPVDTFTFWGFLPIKKGKREKVLTKIAESGISGIIFESPYRIERLIEEIVEIIGAETDMVILREATKIHEEVLRGKAKDLVNMGRKWKGEIVVIISGKSS